MQLLDFIKTVQLDILGFQELCINGHVGDYSLKQIEILSLDLIMY